MGLVTFFQTTEILSDLKPEDIAFLAESSSLIECPEGTVIISIGDSGRYLWVVYEGEVDVSLPDELGKERILASLERGSFFGEMSILSGEPAAANVTASRNSKVVRIPRDIISQVIARNPKALMKVTKIITQRLLEDEKFIEEVKQRRLAHRQSEDPYDLNFSSVSEPMKILVVNSGSSSLKYSFFDTVKKESLLDGLVEKIGSGKASHVIKKSDVKPKAPGRVHRHGKRRLSCHVNVEGRRAWGRGRYPGNLRRGSSRSSWREEILQFHAHQRRGAVGHKGLYPHCTAT